MTDFSFKRFDFKRKPSSTEAEPTSATTRALALVSKEDIYHEHYAPNKKVLIMRKGIRISPHAIPSLLRFGVKPEQFTLTEVEVTQEQALAWAIPPTKHFGSSVDLPLPPACQFKLEALSSSPDAGAAVAPKNIPWLSHSHASRPSKAPFSPSSEKSSGMGSPPLKIEAAPPQAAPSLIEHVVIFDPNPRSLKRTIGCFEGCGISNRFIHAVPLLENVLFVIQKYQPTWIVLDFHPLIALEVIQIIQQIQQQEVLTPFLESVFLTVDLPAKKKDDEEWKNRITSQLELLDAIPLFKPITRFEVMSCMGINTERSA